MEKNICCVCEVPLETGEFRIGNRYFCEYHFNKASTNRRGIWISTLAGIAAIAAVVVIVAALEPAIGSALTGGAVGAWITGAVLSLLPALIWLGVFYRLDRLEPEPKGYVLGIFVLGAVLARGIAMPVLEGMYQVGSWFHDIPLGLRIVASILTYGIIHEYLKYAVVRFSIFKSAEFDERVDGVIYGSAVGLGFAFMLNLSYIFSMDGMDMSVAAIKIATVSLSHACAGGISGYFLGRAKFEELPFWWLPLGVVLAACLNGIERILIHEISRQGLTYKPAFGLILAIVIAAAVFWVLFYLIDRINKKALSDTSTGGGERE
jgi:protease PrsW